MRRYKLLPIAISILATAVMGISPIGAQPAPRANTAADTCFTRSAYQDLLGRQPTAAEVNDWNSRLAAGADRGTLAVGLAHTPEWARVVVTGLYHQILLRDPDPGGLQYWAGRLAGGERTASLAGLLYASDEFYNKAGGTIPAYVDAVYRNLLQRDPDAGGRQYWINRLQGGESRTVIASQFFLSLESNRRRVDALYLQLLGRESDPTGREYWAKRLVNDDDLVLAGLLVGSNEYYTRAQGRCGAAVVEGTITRVTNGSLESENRDISNDGRYVLLERAEPKTLSGQSYTVNNVFVWDRNTGSTTRVTNQPVFLDAYGSRLSGDGRYVAYTAMTSDQVPAAFRWDRTTGTTAQVSAHTEYDDNGSTAGDVTDQGSVVYSKGIWNEASGYFLRRVFLNGTALTPVGEAATAPLVSADGRYITYLAQSTGPDEPARLISREVATGATRVINNNGVPEAMSADGRYVAYSGDSSSVYVWDRATGTSTRLSPSSDAADEPGISADGRYVTWSHWANTSNGTETWEQRNVVLWDRNTGVATDITTPAANAGANPTVSADGRHVSYDSSYSEGVAAEAGNHVRDVFMWDRRN